MTSTDNIIDSWIKDFAYESQFNNIHYKIRAFEELKTSINAEIKDNYLTKEQHEKALKLVNEMIIDSYELKQAKQVQLLKDFVSQIPSYDAVAINIEIDKIFNHSPLTKPMKSQIELASVGCGDHASNEDKNGDTNSQDTSTSNDEGTSSTCEPKVTVQSSPDNDTKEVIDHILKKNGLEESPDRSFFEDLISLGYSMGKDFRHDLPHISDNHEQKLILDLFKARQVVKSDGHINDIDAVRIGEAKLEEYRKGKVLQKQRFCSLIENSSKYNEGSVIVIDRDELKEYLDK